MSYPIPPSAPPPYNPDWPGSAPTQTPLYPQVPGAYEQPQPTPHETAANTHRAARQTFSWPAAVAIGLITLATTYANDVKNPRALIISTLVAAFFGFVVARSPSVPIVVNFHPFPWTRGWGIYGVHHYHMPWVTFFPTTFSSSFTPRQTSSASNTIHVDPNGQASTTRAPLSVTGTHANYGQSSTSARPPASQRGKNVDAPPLGAFARRAQG